MRTMLLSTKMCPQSKLQLLGLLARQPSVLLWEVLQRNKKTRTLIKTLNFLLAISLFI
jgi:hypothetical protein